MAYAAYHAAYDMPICAEICRAEQKYMPFFGAVTERAFRKKKSKAREHICVLDFFPGLTDKG